MFGPYQAKNDSKNRKIINYVGNKLFPAFIDIQRTNITTHDLNNRLDRIVKEEYFYHLHRIDNGIFFAAVEFFKLIGAEWCNLPLTTLMISSPGEVYAGKTLDYTTDTLPVDLKWFDNERKIFLSESSQFYLELRLMIDKVDKVFSIYNSFRKEKSDITHLSEFQHIEFEGHISFTENVRIAKGILKFITDKLLEEYYDDLAFFLSESDLISLSESFNNDNFIEVTFKDALNILEQKTGNSVYKEFSMKNFGSWEEVKLTELLGGHAIITEFPLNEIPFYHSQTKQTTDGKALAENADIVLSGYREVIGSGVRIGEREVLMEKAKIFNLPPEDYEPYFQTRGYDQYKQSSGFGLGWQRYVHWLIKSPYIWETTHVPRTHLLPKP